MKMISEWWAGLVNSLADRGIPLYYVTDFLDDHGVPSWAVFAALALVLVFTVVFVVFPGVQYRLDVMTTPGARVIVSYGEERLTSTTETGNVTFSLPLGATASVRIMMDGCEPALLEIVMLDHYSFEKQLEC